MGEALDVVRRHYEAFQAEDWDAFFALYDPAVRSICRARASRT
jgi:hypothetical protein